MKIFIDQTIMTTYVVPFVIGMLLAQDSIIGIFIPSSIPLLASLFHYCRLLLMRHYDQRPFDKTMCDAIIANGGVK